MSDVDKIYPTHRVAPGDKKTTERRPVNPAAAEEAAFEALQKNLVVPPLQEQLRNALQNRITAPRIAETAFRSVTGNLITKQGLDYKGPPSTWQPKGIHGTEGIICFSSSMIEAWCPCGPVDNTTERKHVSMDCLT